MLLLCHHPLIRLDNKSSHQTTIRDAGCVAPNWPKNPTLYFTQWPKSPPHCPKCPILYFTQCPQCPTEYNTESGKYLSQCPSVLLWCPAVGDTLRHCLAALLSVRAPLGSDWPSGAQEEPPYHMYQYLTTCTSIFPQCGIHMYHPNTAHENNTKDILHAKSKCGENWLGKNKYKI